MCLKWIMNDYACSLLNADHIQLNHIASIIINVHDFTVCLNILLSVSLTAAWIPIISKRFVFCLLLMLSLNTNVWYCKKTPQLCVLDDL